MKKIWEIRKRTRFLPLKKFRVAELDIVFKGHP
jgi:hypothetical protein